MKEGTIWCQGEFIWGARNQIAESQIAEYHIAESILRIPYCRLLLKMTKVS